MIDKLIPGGSYETKDGHPARVYATDAGGCFPVHGAVMDADGTWRPATWTEYGSTVHGEELTPDLVPVRRRFRFERWVNVYPSNIGSCLHESAGAADSVAGSARIACVRVIIEGREGDGLDGAEGGAK